MNRKKHICMATFLCLILFAGGCADSIEWRGSLEDLLRSQPEHFGVVMQNPEQHRLQIIYTQIDRDASNQPSFHSFSYRLNADEYFYPASTVKLPTALLALEKLRRLNVAGLDRDTTMLTGASRDSQQAATEDDSAPGNLPTIGHYVRKILLVSDNDAFNRLYEFLGQAALNSSLRAKGFANTRIMHRLEMALSVDDNRYTNPIRFLDGDKVIFEQPSLYSERANIASSPILLGKAEIANGERQPGPKDFAEKNELSLQDLHDVIQGLIFPHSLAADRRFDLTSDDYAFVYRNMSAYPGDSGIPGYSDADEYPDGYVKFLMFGGEEQQIPENIRVFNKVGDAYGFLTDAAYIIDLENQIEFILAATIYTNANETFNDDNYEYADVGLPFLRELGNTIYALELERARAYPPDLSRFATLE